LAPGKRQIKPGKSRKADTESFQGDSDKNGVTGLDPKHPIYNFLIEYYGLKGAKGVKRLLRWSPSPQLMLNDHCNIQSLDELKRLSSSKLKDTSTIARAQRNGGILLEGATDDDFGSTLHLRGANISSDGVVYAPSAISSPNLCDNPTPDPSDQQTRKDIANKAAPFVWYQSILQQTLKADPVLHCYGLHEWAMQYQPPGAPQPRSAKYQQHLPMRVTREVLNETVERKGISCTHVDALRFFAAPALPLNRFGGPLQRNDQVRLEQPACVHAAMDLLKVTLKLQPYCDASLLERVLEVALEARALDVAASPYDASSYGVGVIPIETTEGRAEYKRLQIEIMKRSEPVRRDLLDAYNCFLALAFDSDDILAESRNCLPR
jgi:hypothetical protein